MRNSVLTFTTILFFNLSFAQQLPLQWTRTFKAQGKVSDRIAGIVTDASGNIYVSGYAGNHHGSPDAFAMKRNPQGDTLWVYYYDAGDNKEDYASKIVVDNTGNAYITGRSQGVTNYNFDCFTVKIDPAGNEAWHVRFSPGNNTQSYGNALTVDGSGNVYVAGYTDPASGSYNWLVIKYNSSGIQQWVDTLNGPGNGDDEAIDIAIAPNGNITACGYAYSLNASGNINSFVKQYTPAGSPVWMDTWNNSAFTGTDKAYGLGYNAAGELLIGGETMNNSSNNKDAFAIKYDGAGNRQWVTIYSDSTSANDEYLRQVIVDTAGNVYFTGTDYRDGYVTRINNDGTQGWRRIWRGPVTNGSDVFHGIAVDNAGNAFVTGRGVYPGNDYYGNGGLTNMIISKYNANGDSVWSYRCSDSINCSMGFAIAYSNGKVYAGGFVTDTAYVNENLYTIIVDTSGNAVDEWIYNGKGDAITTGQLVLTDASDNVYCAATVDRLYGEGLDIVLIKYDPAGSLLWEKYYSSYGWNNDTITAMKFDPSGNLILCISSDSAKLKNNYRLSLLKINQNGNFLDTAWYAGVPAGSLLANAMVVDNNSNISLTATSNILGGIVIHFDSVFNTAWTAKMDSTPFALLKANSIDLFSNGDLLVGGNTQTSGSWNGLVQRYSPSGIKYWSTVIDSANVYDEVRDVSVNASGDVAFTGASGGSNTFVTITGKLDGNTGSLNWQQTYNPNTSNEAGVKVRFTPSGDIALISRGWTGSVARYYTLQYSGSGLFQWAKVYSQTPSDREPVKLLVEPSGRVVTAGWAINGFTTNYDYVLAGYTSAGAVDFINTYSDTLPVSFSWDQLRDLTRDNQGNFIVTGQSSKEFYNNYLFNMLTIKYGGTAVEVENSIEMPKTTSIVYPNPSTTGRYTLVDPAPDRLLFGKIFDINGRLIQYINIKSDQINLVGYKPGIYFLELTHETTPAQTIRIVNY